MALNDVFSSLWEGATDSLSQLAQVFLDAGEAVPPEVQEATQMQKYLAGGSAGSGISAMPDMGMENALPPLEQTAPPPSPSLRLTPQFAPSQDMAGPSAPPPSLNPLPAFAQDSFTPGMDPGAAIVPPPLSQGMPPTPPPTLSAPPPMLGAPQTSASGMPEFFEGIEQRMEPQQSVSLPGRPESTPPVAIGADGQIVLQLPGQAPRVLGQSVRR